MEGLMKGVSTTDDISSREVNALYQNLLTEIRRMQLASSSGCSIPNSTPKKMSMSSNLGQERKQERQSENIRDDTITMAINGIK